MIGRILHSFCSSKLSNTCHPFHLPSNTEAGKCHHCQFTVCDAKSQRVTWVSQHCSASVSLGSSILTQVLSESFVLLLKQHSPSPHLWKLVAPWHFRVDSHECPSLSHYPSVSVQKSSETQTSCFRWPSHTQRHIPRVILSYHVMLQP